MFPGIYVGGDPAKEAGQSPPLCKCMRPTRHLQCSTRNILCNHWFYTCQDPMYGCDFQQFEDPLRGEERGPRCDCGLVCLSLVCVVKSPDFGRHYFSCGSGRREGGCKFFLWADELEIEDGRPYCYCNKRCSRRQTTSKSGSGSLRKTWFFGCQNWKSHSEPGCAIVLFQAAFRRRDSDGGKSPLCKCQVPARKLRSSSRNLKCNYEFYSCKDPVLGCEFFSYIVPPEPAPLCFCTLPCTTLKQPRYSLFTCASSLGDVACNFVVRQDLLEPESSLTPYCYCGARCKKQQVKRQSANLGKWYYICPFWNPFNPSCTLFLWEDGSHVSEGEGEAVKAAENEEHAEEVPSISDSSTVTLYKLMEKGGGSSSLIPKSCSFDRAFLAKSSIPYLRPRSRSHTPPPDKRSKSS